jgi:hypothetical protein
MTDFSGRWNATINSPIGKMDVVFDIVDEQGVLTGTSSNDSETVDILEGVADGNRLTWELKVTTPMKLTLKFDVTVEGDTMTGTAKAGILPGAKLTGSRAGAYQVTTP